MERKTHREPRSIHQHVLRGRWGKKICPRWDLQRSLWCLCTKMLTVDRAPKWYIEHQIPYLVIKKIFVIITNLIPSPNDVDERDIIAGKKTMRLLYLQRALRLRLTRLYASSRMPSSVLLKFETNHPFLWKQPCGLIVQSPQNETYCS